MKFYNYKGKRIRASDKSLAFRFYAGTLPSVFTVVLLLLNSRQLMRTDRGAISLRNGITFTVTPYHVFTLIVASAICSLLAFLYFRFCFDYRKQIQHRQKLACMILDNRWYEFESVQGNSFFTDLPSSKTKEKITHFPKLTTAWKKGSFCTRLANAGMNPKALQYLMGHSNITMTLDYYAHAIFHSAKAKMERLTMLHIGAERPVSKQLIA